MESLSAYRHLTVVDFGKNQLGEAAHQLAKSISSLGYQSQLQELWLYGCSLPVTVSLKLLQSLSMCRQLTTLNLSENKLGEAGHCLAKLITSWGDETRLQKLWLHNYSLTATAVLEIVQSPKCKQLTVTCCHYSSIPVTNEPHLASRESKSCLISGGDSS